MVKNIFILCLAIVALTGCLPGKKAKGDPGKIKVLNSDMAFSVEELKSEPGKKVSFKLFNGLKKEPLKFYLLKTGEDPILVQHINAQQGVVPSEYFIFESKNIEPNTEMNVSFQAPGEEGTYSFVGVSGSPKETMVGRLIVKKKAIELAEDVETEIN